MRRPRGVRAMNPLTHYFRAQFHRRVFAWFGMAIALTAFSVAGLGALASAGNGSEWHRNMRAVPRVLGGEFSRLWDDPPARAPARDLARPRARGAGRPPRCQRRGALLRGA